MQQSEYFNMNLPEGPDHYNVEDFNQNTRLIDEILHNLSYTLLSSVLRAGDTEVTFRDSAISRNVMIDVYTNLPGLNYTEITVSSDETSVTLTFEAQVEDVLVKLLIH